MRLILIAFAFLLVFFLSSRVKVFRTEDCSTPSSVLHIREFAVAICRRNLPWEFFARICRGFFCIYKRILFCICEQILFIWKQTFFICEQNVLICEIFSINSVLFVTVVAVMGHRTYTIIDRNCDQRAGSFFIINIQSYSKRPIENGSVSLLRDFLKLKFSPY